MRRYYHYKKRLRPFPVEILSAMQDDTKHTSSPIHLDVNPFVECAKKYRAVCSGLIKVAQGLRDSFTINKRKSGI